MGITDQFDSPLSMATSAASTTTSAQYPPALTTVFTPDPSCTNLYYSYHNPPATLVAEIFPGARCYESGEYTSRSSLSCFPASDATGRNIVTYSPGYFCPVGMTTAGSAISPDGFWCCPTGLQLTWVSTAHLCQNTLTQGKFLLTNGCNIDSDTTFPFGGGEVQILPTEVRTTGYQYAPRGVDIFPTTASVTLEITIATVLATPIFLGGQKLTTTTPITSGISSSAGTAPVPGPSGDGNSINPQHTLSDSAKVGIALGSTLAVAFSFALVLFLIRRRRKGKTPERETKSSTTQANHEDYVEKPELEGSKACVYTGKAELDPTTTRSELEGAPGKSYGDGIYLQKPELEGTMGTARNRGMYVRTKPELEAVSKPYPAIVSGFQLDTAELEAIPVSHPRGETSSTQNQWASKPSNSLE
ncbi:hypothetical protein F5Y19DRAFT_482154 [Xylariaceae sp. FL1651]|nr:hypothetical protein F5Y19DRAFT_482154 [Xylariaceae sp. FL1651]